MRDDIYKFFALTISISWLLQLPLFAGYFNLRVSTVFVDISRVAPAAPAIAALWLTFRRQGPAGVNRLLRRLIDWRQSWYWYLLALLPVAFIRILALTILFFLPQYEVFPHFTEMTELCQLFLLWIILVPLEELGWRGYALPKMLEDRTVFRASVIVGCWWAIWHMPIMFLQADVLPGGSFWVGFPIFVVSTVASSVFLALLFVRTKGSLTLPVLFHAASNTANGIFLLNPGAVLTHTLIALVIGVLYILALMWWFKETIFGRPGLKFL